jgi:hypothetical protein
VQEVDEWSTEEDEENDDDEEDDEDYDEVSGPKYIGGFSSSWSRTGTPSPSPDHSSCHPLRLRHDIVVICVLEHCIVS